MITYPFDLVRRSQKIDPDRFISGTYLTVGVTSDIVALRRELQPKNPQGIPVLVSTSPGNEGLAAKVAQRLGIAEGMVRQRPFGWERPNRKLDG